MFHYISSVEDIAYSRTAMKALTRMPRPWAERIRDKGRAYAADPAALANNVKRLKGQAGLVRLRVGDWRIIMREGSGLSEAQCHRAYLLPPQGLAPRLPSLPSSSIGYESRP